MTHVAWTSWAEYFKRVSDWQCPKATGKNEQKIFSEGLERWPQCLLKHLPHRREYLSSDPQNPRKAGCKPFALQPDGRQGPGSPWRATLAHAVANKERTFWPTRATWHTCNMAHVHASYTRASVFTHIKQWTFHTEFTLKGRRGLLQVSTPLIYIHTYK